MKKTISVIMSAVLVCSGCALNSFAGALMNEAYEEPVADAYVTKPSIDEPTSEMMEQMIKKVRPKITVPEDYTEFYWDFKTARAGTNSSWYFAWSGKNGEIIAECDTEGRIFGYQVYEYSKERKTLLPSVSPESLLPKAEEFIKKTAPHLSELDLRLTSTDAGSIRYAHTYSYSFTRYENDICVPQNTVNVEVNYETGEVVAFSANIPHGLDFKTEENILSVDEAKKKISENQKMSLSYKLKTEYDDEGNIKERKAYLVYTPESSYLSIDAFTGEAYTARDSWQALKYSSAMGGVMMDSMASKNEAAEEEGESGEYRLSEEELEQLAVLESLISKDEAQKLILSDGDLYIPENAYLSDARLTRRNSGVRPLGSVQEKEEKYSWNLYFSTPGDIGFGANAVIDAHDGSLISYSADLPYVYHYEKYDIEIPEVTISRDEAVAKASAFIKKHQSEKHKYIAFSADSPYAPMKYLEENGKSVPVYRASTLNFVRQNEGIDFTYNRFRVGVDYSTGKITSFGFTWFDDVIFESPKDAVGEKAALEALYNDNGFELSYEINTQYTYIDGVKNSTTATPYTRAVYSLISPYSTTVRALDGVLTDYSGEEVSREVYTGKYTDIQNHWAKHTIERFTWIGYGPCGDKFNPGGKISGTDYLNLLSTIGIYGYNAESEKLESLTRMDAVKLIIDYLGYGKIASLKNVFITDFADRSDFSEADVGYAAIARGFGLIEGDGENFRPYDVLTRAEALTLAENAVENGLCDNR